MDFCDQRRAWPIYPLYKMLVGPQGRSVRVRKILSAPGFDASSVQPVACHYPGFLKSRICWFLYQVVVQSALQPCCRLDFVQKQCVSLIAWYFNSSSGSHILSPFSGLPVKTARVDARRSDSYTAKPTDWRTWPSCTVSFMLHWQCKRLLMLQLTSSVTSWDIQKVVCFVLNVILGVWGK